MAEMNSRERVKRAIHFRGPDRIPVRQMAMEAARYEHGERLNGLFREFPGDFGAPIEGPIPHPDPAHVDAEGRYRRVRTDEWGVTWEHRIFGIAGHPLKRPLDDWANLDSYQPPPVGPTNGPEFEQRRAAAERHKENCYLLDGWANLFEILHAVRRYEDVLMDIYDDGPEINRLADMIAERQAAEVRRAIAVGADGIMYADDWGSQSALLVSPGVWRRFFRPRYERMMAPALEAGVEIFFHSCGYVLPLIEELSELGVNVVWPQLSANDPKALGDLCRRLDLCVEAHIDRQRTMTLGTPADVEAAVFQAAETLGDERGGVIWHGEIDNGFPWGNVEQLYRSFDRYSKPLTPAR